MYSRVDARPAEQWASAKYDQYVKEQAAPYMTEQQPMVHHIEGIGRERSRDHLACSRRETTLATVKRRPEPSSHSLAENVHPDGGYLHKYMGCARESVVIPFSVATTGTHHQHRGCGGSNDRARSRHDVPWKCRRVSKVNFRFAIVG